VQGQVDVIIQIYQKGKYNIDQNVINFYF